MLSVATLVASLVQAPRGLQHRGSPIRLVATDAPIAATDCWRPTLDDVDRISWGKPAKRKGTGSRGIPHRLNDEVGPRTL